VREIMQELVENFGLRSIGRELRGVLWGDRILDELVTGRHHAKKDFDTIEGLFEKVFCGI